MAAVLPIAILTIMVSPGATQAQAPPDKRPNILIVVTDDQRLNTMVVMRHMARVLRDGGVTFTNA